MSSIEVPIPATDIELAETLDVIVAAGEIIADRELDQVEPSPALVQLAHEMLQGPSLNHSAEEASIILDQFTEMIKHRWEHDGEA